MRYISIYCIVLVFLCHSVFAHQAQISFAEESISAIAESIVDVNAKFHSTEQFQQYLKLADAIEGQFKFISKELSRHLIEELKKENDIDFKIKPGGSLSNTMSVLANLGIKITAITAIGKDQFGNIIQNDLQKNGAKTYMTYCTAHSTPTALILISPEGSKTMLTSSGCFTEFNASIINYKNIQRQRLVIAESFLLNHVNARALLSALFRYSKEQRVETALTLSNKAIVARFKDDIDALLPNVDILIGNKKEFLTLTNTNNLSELIKHLKRMNKLSVVTLGEEGALVVDSRTHNAIVFKMPAKLAKNVIDVTGAGDNFAAGFLYGYLTGERLENSAALGNTFGNAVVQQLGARLHKPEMLLRHLD